MINMKIVELPINEISKIKPLWELLNKTHYENSNNWKSHFAEQTFEKRFEKLKTDKNVLILAAIVDDNIIAYCFSVANDTSGEIASIFVGKEFRNQSLGKKLISKSIAWMKSKKIKKIVIGVAEGNEKVFPIYEGIGFKKSATVFKLQ
jgi:ribosomal protein S18 acetylase RimI-like enzyme